MLTLLFIYPFVALSLYFTIHGFPKTTLWLGTSQFTKVLGAINTSSPIWICPIIVALTPIQTSLPMMGAPFLLPRFSCPIVTPLWILQLQPMIASELIVIQYTCPKRYLTFHKSQYDASILILKTICDIGYYYLFDIYVMPTTKNTHKNAPPQNIYEGHNWMIV